MYRAVIFDFDGVILNSGRIKTEAFPLVFESHPQHHEAILNYHIENQGISRYEKFEWVYRELLNQSLDPEIKTKLGDRFSEIVLEKVLEADFITGVQELLKYLRQSEVKSFIASGTPESELRLIVEKRNLTQYFDGVFGSPEQKTSIVQRISQHWNIPTSTMLFIGDATTDYYAAMSSGTDFVAVDSEELNSFWIDKNVRLTKDLSVIIDLFND